MLKKLRKTWQDEEKQSQNSPPRQEGTSIEQLRYTPPPPNTIADVEPNVVGNVPSKFGHKRTRDVFEPEAQLPQSERPAKAIRTGFSDSIRNHLPEIVDGRDRDDGQLPLSLGAMKEQVFEQAKQQNSKLSSFSFGAYI